MPALLHIAEYNPGTLILRRAGSSTEISRFTITNPVVPTNPWASPSQSEGKRINA